MSLENGIKDIITKKLEDGTVEKLVEEQLEKGINKALDNLFNSYGDGTEIIEKKIKSVMVPYLENFDYSKYIVKLDSVLVDVLEATTKENRLLMYNFKDLMASERIKEIKVTELFEKWQCYVEDNVDVSGLDVCLDDIPSYYPVDVRFELIESEGKSWSSRHLAKLVFECKHDENMNFEINLSRWDSDSENTWDIIHERTRDINSLKYINEFEIFLMNLSQNTTKIIIDKKHDTEEVYPQQEPEISIG